ncbi:MAG TPA: MFS transporter [Rhodoglobus sp.]|nr:MFS transporter [Rhodoglobus sp.]
MSDSTMPGPRRGAGWITRIAIMAGLGVAVIYIPQPIQPLVADEFDLPLEASAGGVIAAQFGYAAGVFLLVALGDRVRARRQVATHLVGTALAIAVAAIAPWNELFVVACFVAGMGATYGQLLVPVALRAVPASARAVTTGVLVGSFLVGLFLVRTGLGALADLLGWRPTLLVCAAVILACTALLSAVPSVPVTDPPSYLRLLASLPGIMRRSPALVLMTVAHACVFAAFATLWATSIVFAVAELDFDVARAALLGLAGLAGGATTVLLARVYARLSRRTGLMITIGAALAGGIALAVGSSVTPIVVIALYLVSAGMVGSQVFTQARALQAVDPAESGRANTVYVTGTFVLSSIAIAVGSAVQRGFGFEAVALMCLALLLASATTLTVAWRRQLL